MWLAEDGGGTAVALKALHPALASSDAARTRLRRETRTVNAVRSPFVAHIVDAETDASQPFVVSEYVAGPTLAEVVQSGPVPMRGVAALSYHLASTIAAVHRADVIHRDIKPSNIICSQRGPVLIDFGIAMGAEDEHLTSTGLVSGTAGYTAPELLAGRPPSRHSDWWAWCATLLSCATGRPPFGSGDMKATILRVMQGEPDLAGLSPRIAAALGAGLGTEPEGRPSPSLVVADLMGAAGWAPGELDYVSVNWAELLNTGERTVPLSSDPQEIAAPPQWDEGSARPPVGAARPVGDGPQGMVGAAQGASGADGAGAAGTGTAAPGSGAPLRVTYHDACFLGRHNRVYSPPRELVAALPGVELVEMPRNRDRAMCCGAGGAHAWFEETRGTRIAEAAQTGADVVATACPFCSQMLGSASGSSAGLGPGASDGQGAAGSGLPQVRDVAVMLLEAVRRGQDGRAPEGD